MRIAIKFGDNDFTCVFECVFELLELYFDKDDNVFNNKEQLYLLINSLMFPAYLLKQNKFSYSAEDFKHYEYLRDLYLKIKGIDNLLINEEVDKYLAENDWDNGEVFVYTEEDKFFTR